MAPPPRSRIGSRTSWVASIGARRFRSRVAPHSEGLASGNCGSTWPPPPALFTRMCGPSSCSRANATSRSRSALSVTSVRTNRPRTSRAVSTPAWSSRSATTTVAPLAASRSANTRPVPAAAPVTIATLPSSSTGCSGREAETLRALHRLGAVAHVQLAVERAGVLLHGVWGEEQPLGDLLVGGARGHQREHLALPVRERSGGLLGAWREDRHPLADHAHGHGHVVRGPVLRDEARRTGRLGGLRRDPAGPGDQQYARAGRLAPDRLAQLRARLLAEEQVDERHVGLVAPGQLERLLHARRGQAAPDPRLLGEQEAKAPVHDVVVVHHEHPQVALGAHSAGSSSIGTTSRTRQSERSRPSGPNSTRAPRPSASTAARRRPMPVPREPRLAPSLRTSSRKVPSVCPTCTRTLVGSACLYAFRSASASTDWASGSTSSGTSTPSSHSSSSGRSL